MFTLNLRPKIIKKFIIDSLNDEKLEILRISWLKIRIDEDLTRI